MYDKINNSFTSVTDRLKEVFMVGSDAAVARELGMSPAAFSNRKQTGSLPYEQIVEVADTRNLDIRYIFTGHKSQEGVQEPGSAIVSRVDTKMLAICIEAADAMIREMGVELPPDKRAQIVSLLYEEYGTEEEPVIDGEKVVRLIRLAS